ncbi:MAG: CRTAC1 family protein [Planctomycetota bacterium]
MPRERLFRTLLALAAVVVARPATADFTDFGSSLLGVNLNSRSASLADIDNDDDLDLLFQGSTGAQKLYRNELETGSLGFTLQSDWTNLGVTAGSWSTAWGDINGDGFVDAFVGQSNIGQVGDVLVNDGTGGFINESFSRNLADPGFHQNVAWADMNNDNRLDLVIAMEGPDPFVDERHEIYLQDASGSFTAAGAAAGFQQDFGTKAYGMAIGDADGDGDLDVYISTCRRGGNIRNNFYENQYAQTGVMSFIDIADDNGTQYLDNSYGAEFHDFDDDGDLDLFVVGADSEDSKIYRNDGGNQFTDVDTITGRSLLSDVSGDLNGGKAIDYDNDGDLDLFFHDHDARNNRNNARKLYRNNGDWSFTDVTFFEGLAEVNRGSYDSPWGDLDRDGDQDLIGTTDSGTLERIFLSDESENGNTWLYVELTGDSGNSTAIGAAVYATIHQGTPEERTLRREANTNAGTFNQSDVPVHFGLGDATIVDELRIVWPNGVTNVYTDVAVDQYAAFAIANIEGDFNGDGAVNNDDLNLLLNNWGETDVAPEWVNGLSGAVDNEELNRLLNSWGVGTGAPVPEPATLLLSLCGLAALRRR